jgi:hypothetical protein
MSIISDLLVNARYELQDMGRVKFSDFELMNRYNQGNKLLRKTILDNLPMQLAEEITGTVNANEAISMAKKPIKLIDVRINKRRIDRISVMDISDRTTTGEPKAYYLLNTNTIKLYPLPDKSYPYVITYIPETVATEETEDSGYQTDVEELLVRYIVATLTGEGFDFAAEYNRTVGNLLTGIETGVTVVDGYYPYNGSRGGDY